MRLCWLFLIAIGLSTVFYFAEAQTTVSEWSDLKDSIDSQADGSTVTYVLPSNGLLNTSPVGHVLVDGGKRVVIEGNGCVLDGGTTKSFFWLDGGSLTLSGPMMLRNGSSLESAPYLEGGAVRVLNGHFEAEKVTFASNIGLYNSNGGAVSLSTSKSKGIFTSCQFRFNFASNYGGAVAVRAGAAAEFTNCVFEGNGQHPSGAITTYGGAVSAERSSTITFTKNCSFSNDNAQYGSAISSFTGVSVAFEGCDSTDEVAFRTSPVVALMPPLSAHLDLSRCNASGAYMSGISDITSVASCCEVQQAPQENIVKEFFEDEVWRTTFIIAVFVCILTAYAARYYYTRNAKARHHSDLDLPEPESPVSSKFRIASFALRTKQRLSKNSALPRNCCCFSYSWRGSFSLGERGTSSVDKPWLIKYKQLKVITHNVLYCH
jgi:hypothetical protein